MTVNLTTTYATCTCYLCGIPFAAPEHYFVKRREDGKSFHCPNGHSQHYGEGSVKELQRKLAQEQQAHDQTKARAREAEEAAAKEQAKAKRLRTRAANGVCPCCKRTFRELARHMESKHPDYAGNKPAKSS